jgi:hypothetical protein
MEDADLVYECRECGYKFEDAQQLKIHKERFCVGCDMHDAEALAAAAKKQYDRYKVESLGEADAAAEDMLIEHDQDLMLDEAMDGYMRERAAASREKEIDLRSEAAAMQANTEHEDRIRRLLKGLEKTKEDEFKAVLRAQQYTRHLNDMDREHLEVLQEQTQRKMSELQRQRSEIEAEEAAHAAELREMEDQALALAQSKDRDAARLQAKLRQNQRSEKQSSIADQVALAQLHGEGMSALRQQIDALALERAEIAEAQARNRRGELPLPRQRLPAAAVARPPEVCRCCHAPPLPPIYRCTLAQRPPCAQPLSLTCNAGCCCTAPHRALVPAPARRRRRGAVARGGGGRAWTSW